MKSYTEEIRNLFLNLNDKDKNFLGGIPYLINIERQLRNYDYYIQNGLTKRQRTNIGKPYFDKEKLIGYTSFTVMQNAKPTNYEREFIDLNDRLNYIQFKQSIVKNNFKGKGVEDEMIKYRLNIAKLLGKILFVMLRLIIMT
jgi:hypothetical protein